MRRVGHLLDLLFACDGQTLTELETAPGDDALRRDEDLRAPRRGWRCYGAGQAGRSSHFLEPSADPVARQPWIHKYAEYEASRSRSEAGSEAKACRQTRRRARRRRMRVTSKPCLRPSGTRMTSSGMDGEGRLPRRSRNRAASWSCSYRAQCYSRHAVSACPTSSSTASSSRRLAAQAGGTPIASCSATPTRPKAPRASRGRSKRAPPGLAGPPLSTNSRARRSWPARRRATSPSRARAAAWINSDLKSLLETGSVM